MFSRPLVVAGLLVAISAFAQSGMPDWREKGWCSYHYPLDRAPPPRINLPGWVCEATYSAGLQRTYTPYTKMNPFFISGDFDGDGSTDIAVWVQHNKTHKRGVLILTKDGNNTFIAGAGRNVEERGDDYGGLDAWSMLRKGEVLDSRYEDGKVTLKGDAIILEKSESAGFAIYWNGQAFKFYQVSD